MQVVIISSFKPRLSK